jgi:hypothetical protein
MTEPGPDAPTGLAHAIERAGSPGGIRFTEQQLYYELCRGRQPWHRLPRRPGFTIRSPVSLSRFAAALRRHGTIPGLLPDQLPPGPTPSQVPDEVFDYALPRLLICQSPSIAAMLRANDLHLESACPVYALMDLPLDPRLRSALKAGHDSHGGTGTVYVLHDASEFGTQTVERVRKWAGDLPVCPLGLRPEHARALHLPARCKETVELAAVNPARLLRTVHRLVRGYGRVRPSESRLRQVRSSGYLSWPAK